MNNNAIQSIERKNAKKAKGGRSELEKEVDLRDILTGLSSIEEKLNRMEQQNKETQMLLRILAQPILWSSLTNIFTKPQQLWAYELSDGRRSTRDIGKIVGVDQKTISTWWRDFADLGITEKTGERGQFKSRYTLLELMVLHSLSEKEKNQHGKVEQKNENGQFEGTTV